MENNGGFTDAVARARQIAAKLAGGGAPVGQVTSPGAGGAAAVVDKGGNLGSTPAGVKRSFDDSAGPDTKRFLPSDIDTSGGQSRVSADQQRLSSEFVEDNDTASMNSNDMSGMLGQSANLGSLQPGAKQMRLGVDNGLSPTMMSAGGSNSMGAGSSVTEEYKIPDRMVGLVIGKGGEQISRLQVDSGCRIQIAPDSGGRPERSCTLSGSHEAVEKAKHLIDEIIRNAQSAGTPETIPDGQCLVQMLIPGTKVGLVIGKGGETIRSLQDRTRCRMIMVQDSNQPSDVDKPLRITGDPSHCEEARRLVQELLDSKDLLPPGQSPSFGEFPGAGSRGGGGGGGGGSSSGGQFVGDMMVPKSCVGVIIGKGGDMIKRLEADFSVRIQFRQDDGSPQRCCQVTGSQENVYPAMQAIQQLVDDSNRADGIGGRGGIRLPNRGGGGGGRPGFDAMRPGAGMPNKVRSGGDMQGQMYQEATTMRVPAEKCGIIIGKGGENIREICRQTGAHAELQRQPPPNPGEKIFDIRGTPEQIQHAMALIAEKAGIPPPSFSSSSLSSGPGGPPMGNAGWLPPNQPQQQPQHWGPSQSYGAPVQQQQQPPPQQQASWGGYNYNQWGAGGGGQGDQGHDPWQAYYAQYYQPSGPHQPPQQQQPPVQQPAPAQIVPAPQQAPMHHHHQAAAVQPMAHVPQAQSQTTPAASKNTYGSLNPVTGQHDYSEAWAAYYRSIGCHDQAEAVLAQARSAGMAVGGGGGGPMGHQGQ